VIGLVLILFATGIAVTREQEMAYHKDISSLNYKNLEKAEMELYRWRNRYLETKGFFSCDRICTQNYNQMQQAEKALALIHKEFAQTESKAKSKVGVFSEYAVQETRDLFWGQMAGGKEFAKRSSWYDLLFMGIQSMGRDEGLLEFAIRFLINMVMNFTFGLTGALIGFYWYVWGVVSSYQPGFIAGFLFFIMASVAASSFVATFLIGMYTAAAGSVYVAVRAAGPALEDQRRRQEHLRNQRTHRD